MQIASGIVSEQNQSTLFDTSQLRVGLIAYYPFNGNANDNSDNDNNGIIYGATLTADRFGNANNAYYFNNRSYIKVPDDSVFDLTSDFSISSWFNLKQYAITYNASMLISKHDGDIGNDGFIYCIINEFHDNNQYIDFEANGIWGSHPNPKSFVQLNTWYNYIVTFKKATDSLKYYLNGVMVSSEYAPLDIIPNQLSLTIGKSKSSSGTYLDYFKGSIDEIRIYDRVLSKKEITYLSKN